MRGVFHDAPSRADEPSRPLCALLFFSVLYFGINSRSLLSFSVKVELDPFRPALPSFRRRRFWLLEAHRASGSSGGGVGVKGEGGAWFCKNDFGQKPRAAVRRLRVSVTVPRGRPHRAQCVKSH